MIPEYVDMVCNRCPEQGGRVRLDRGLPYSADGGFYLRHRVRSSGVDIVCVRCDRVQPLVVPVVRVS